MPPNSAVADQDVLPDLDNIAVEDGKPVDNTYVEKQNRLLTEPLYVSWAGPGDGRPFIVLANVGLFHTANQPPLVPDVMLSLDAQQTESLRSKPGRSYFVWIMGKVPDVVIEIVSDLRGGEMDEKMKAYARLRIPYYVVYEPDEYLEGGMLQAFNLTGRRYEAISPEWFAEVGLGLKLWEGIFERREETWLRWCDQNGVVLPTGGEKASAEKQRADQLAARLERLEARMRSLGEEVNGA